MVFKSTDEDRIDYGFLRDGAVNLYFRKHLFEKAISELEKLGYKVFRIRFESFQQFRSELSDVLSWELQFGYKHWDGNLDTLNDGLRNVSFIFDKDSVLCIEDFHVFSKLDDHSATELLDILERASRDCLMFGKRFFSLVQTDDPHFSRENLGGNATKWNDAEWLDSARGL
ncbi:MAG: barstar family protein [Pseudomonadota bacterium]